MTRRVDHTTFINHLYLWQVDVRLAVDWQTVDLRGLLHAGLLFIFIKVIFLKWEKPRLKVFENRILRLIFGTQEG